jgi:hypothetical protein
MAETRGGYRKPMNPAPTSGPGALSQRTDGGPSQGAKYISGLPYGQGQATYNQQTAAPMAGTPNIPNVAATPMQMPTPLGAPSGRPNEPITSGIDLGAGPGSSVLNLPTQEPTLASTLRKIAQFDNSGDAEMIYAAIAEYGY